MRLTLALFMLSLIACGAAARAATTDDVRLDHRVTSFDNDPVYDPGSANDPMADMPTSGSDNLMIKIERNGYASDTTDIDGNADTDAESGGNGSLSRDGGFSFGNN